FDSIDKTKKIIESFRDKRIRYYKNKKWLGISKSRNLSLKYSKGETILSPEDKINSIYSIKKGFVCSHSINEEGYELTLNIYKPSSFFPIVTALANVDSSYYFKAISNVVLYIAPVDEVIEYLRSDEEVLFDLTKRLSVGLEGFMIRTQFLIRSDARQKIASSLVMMVRRFGLKDGKKVTIQLPQTHADIASLAGVSRETASIELKKLEREKVIERKGKTTIVLNLLKLQRISILYYEDKPLPYTF
ncbi:MAG: helix-turn-helix domain-containing protein, partial [Candidatus Heimdallarchaeota archaeon]|nr:helix-turn-helix domain-containing protein [Candidatus Heimdallarchaeota archaeon]